MEIFLKNQDLGHYNVNEKWTLAPAAECVQASGYSAEPQCRCNENCDFNATSYAEYMKENPMTFHGVFKWDELVKPYADLSTQAKAESPGQGTLLPH